MKYALRLAAIAAIMLTASCRDRNPMDPDEPDAEPPAALAVTVPETVIRDEAFSLTITALDAEGLTDVTWEGPVALSASDGTLSPATAMLVDGVAIVQATLGGHAGAVTLRASSGVVQSEAATALVLSGEAPARIEIVPAAALLTAEGATQPFRALAYDAQGARTTAQITWRSNDNATLTIDADGLATAAAPTGSAQLFASADGIESAPALVIVAQPVGDPLLLADSQIVTQPEAVDPNAPYEPGWQYRIRVQNAAPQPGDLVIGTGQTPLAGRVVSSTAAGQQLDLVVELVPLNQIFADLHIEETIPLVERAETTGPGPMRGMHPGYAAAIGDTFDIGGFTCIATADLPSLDLPAPTIDIQPKLSLDLLYDGGLQRLVVTGEIGAEFGYRPVIEATFEGRVGCEREVHTLTVPTPMGFLNLFIGIQVPIGIGLELDGKLELGGFGFDVNAQATARAELGFTCLPGGGPCTGVTEFDVERDGSFELVTPNLSDDFRVDLGAHGYLFAKPSIGSSFSKQAQFEMIAATGGLKQSISLAGTHAQVQDTAYASSFDLAALVRIGAGEGITSAAESLGNLLGVDLTITTALVDDTIPIAASPRGTFTIAPERVAPGDSTTLGEMATFTIELDTVNYLGAYAVESVEILWKQDDGNGGFTLASNRPSCTTINATSGQTTFECSTDFLEEHRGEQTFHAFVNALLFGVPLPVPLEISAHAQGFLDVGDCGEAGQLVLTTQAEVDAAAGACEVSSLRIADVAGTTDPIVDLTPLDSLRLVRNLLQIGPTTQLASLAGLERVRLDTANIDISENAALTSLAGLASDVTNASMTLRGIAVQWNPVLSDISSLANLMSGGAAVQQHVNVSGNPMLTGLAGLVNVGSASSVVIGSNDGLGSISDLYGISADGIRIMDNGSLGTLAVSGVDARGVTVNGNPALTSVSIQFAGTRDSAFVTVSNSDLVSSISVQGPGAGGGSLGLTSLPALSSLQISGYGSLRNLWIGPSPQLTTFSGGGASVTHWLDINGTALTSISGLSVPDTIADRFLLRFNDQLTSIAAFSNLTDVAGQFWIFSNPALCVPQWALDVEAGESNIAGNRSGC